MSTESFESIMEAAMLLLSGECAVECRHDKHDDCLHCAAHMAERLKRAHDREIRDTAQQEYHRGYEDGRHSMDAEHRAVVMRLRHLPLDGGSVENVFNIARAVYHNDFGWAANDCAALRDELVRLMGGLSDDTCDSQCRGACADCDGGNHREQTEVSDGGTANDSPADFRGRSCGELVHLDGLVAYDVLWNERHKAVCELRNMHLDTGSAVKKLAIALGIKWNSDNAERSVTLLQKRLIHLLGGDECNFSAGESYMNAMGEKSNPAETSGASTDHVILDTPSPDNGTSPNDVPMASITDELRKWASDRHCKGISHTDVLNIGLIADRIDEQFDRICQQQEAVLQSTIDGMVKEYEHDRLPDQLRIEKLVEQRDEARQECADLLDLLRDAVVDFEYASYSWDYASIVSENITIETERNRLAKECDELQARLNKANGENKGLKLSIDEQKESISQRKKTIKKLTRDNEKVWKKVHELQAKLDAITAALNG